MDKKNDYIQLPPMKKDTSADVVSFIWEYMKLPEDVRNKVKSEMDEIHACWVYVEKYVHHKSLQEMLAERKDVDKFIFAVDTWFEKLLGA